MAPQVSVVIAGQVVALRKKGDSQVFVQLEDGRGRIECSVFAEAYTQLAPLLTRDRILVVQGGLREDEFSGGFSLRVRQCWDYAQLCSSHAQRLSLRLDMRVPGPWDRVDALLSQHRPGGTPLRLDLLLKSGERGMAGVLDVNGPKSVRVIPNCWKRCARSRAYARSRWRSTGRGRISCSSLARKGEG